MEQKICRELFEPHTLAALFFSVPVYMENTGILSLRLLGILMDLFQVEIIEVRQSISL